MNTAHITKQRALFHTAIIKSRLLSFQEKKSKGEMLKVATNADKDNVASRLRAVALLKSGILNNTVT